MLKNIDGHWKVVDCKGDFWFEMLFQQLNDNKHIKNNIGYNSIKLEFSWCNEVINTMLGDLRWGDFYVARNMHMMTKDKAFDFSLIYDNLRIIDVLTIENQDKLNGIFYLSKDKLIVDNDISCAKKIGTFSMERIILKI